ncbi:MAG: hypothetical protein V7K97_18525 [Nostoc sp.]|uniref:hypothetical protein n=1 Tax=Nostoc sp. TaxID=1180 RepID=UPI002FF98B1A
MSTCKLASGENCPYHNARLETKESLAACSMLYGKPIFIGNPMQTFGYVANRLNSFGLVYLHIIDGKVVVKVTYP